MKRLAYVVVACLIGCGSPTGGARTPTGASAPSESDTIAVASSWLAALQQERLDEAVTASVTPFRLLFSAELGCPSEVEQEDLRVVEATSRDELRESLSCLVEGPLFEVAREEEGSSWEAGPVAQVPWGGPRLDRLRVGASDRAAIRSWEQGRSTYAVIVVVTSTEDGAAPRAAVLYRTSSSDE